MPLNFPIKIKLKISTVDSKVLMKSCLIDIYDEIQSYLFAIDNNCPTMSAAQKFKKEPTPLVCPRNLPLSTRLKISPSSFFTKGIFNNAKLCLFYMTWLEIIKYSAKTAGDVQFRFYV